jgi:hypothetical protein
LRGRTAINTRVARQVAELLVSQDPNRLKLGMKLLTQNPNLLGALRNADVALARAGAAQISNATSPGAPSQTPATAFRK